MSLRRSSQNPIITRDDIPDVPPAIVDPTSVFNPGAATFRGRTILMLRVQTRGRETHLMVAESEDGEAFTIRPHTVSLEGLGRIAEAVYHVYDPRITRLGDVYHIVLALDTDAGCRLGIARTDDFVRFEFLGLAADEDVRNGVLFPERRGGRYLRLERPNRLSPAGGPPTGDEIWLAESSDLLAWRPVARVMAGRPHYWDELIGPGPPPVKTRDGWLHVYHGVATHFGSANVYQAGAVLLDLNDPSRVLARTRENILEPREPYELVGQVPNVVFPTGMIVDGYDAEGFARPESAVRIYYGAADTCVCLATTTVGELLMELGRRADVGPRPARGNDMTDRQPVAYLVSHTHWDREWYLTFHQFRVHLSSTMRLVLDQLDRGGSFRHFLLDGQTVVLEDHLETCPADRDRIARLVSSGALSVGPWYVLPDEFLVSGEALVRNLLVGHRVAAAFGPVQKVGYVPDSFGHVAQLPQILRGAGIDSFIYMRGSGDEIADLGSEYLWRAPDGSEVLAVNQCGGYSNAAALGHAELWHSHTRREIDPALAVEKVGALLARAACESNAGVWLLMNGSDHLPPQRDFDAILGALRRAFPDTEFRHGSLAEYLAALRAARPPLKRFEGELLGGRDYHILSGVWSARMQLKQLNDRAQTLLAGTVEPLLSYAHFVLGHEYPQGFLEYAWKLLLKNHPHDSICGCSIDEVHREMLPRFAGVVETGERLLRNALERVVPSFGRRSEDDADTAILVANPLPEVRSEVVERLVVLPPPAPDLARLALLDESGAPVPFEILGATFAERFWGVDYRTEFSFEKASATLAASLDVLEERAARKKSGGKGPTDCFLAIRFLARDLPPVGHAIYRLVERTQAPAEAAPGCGGVTARGDTLENELYEVRLRPNGTFDVLVKDGGWRLEDLNRLEDTEDVGDEYDYSPAEQSRAVSSDGCRGEVRGADVSTLRGRLEARFTLQLPLSIAHGRERRSDTLVACETVVRVGLTTGSPVIDVELEFDNRASDHRLRAEFPTTIRTDAIVSDGHFFLNRRPIAREPHPGWAQPAPSTRPQQDFSLVEDGRRGLAILNRGLPEIEASLDASGAARLSLTLLRAVGWLSRDDFPTRNYQNAGPTLATPDAQCPGRQLLRYALVPYAGDHVTAGVKRLSQEWRVPVVAIQGVWDGHAAGGVGLVRKSSPCTAVTAIKRHEEHDTLIARLCNITGREVQETLTFGPAVAGAWRTDLLEHRAGELSGGAVSAHAVSVALGPHEIVTVEIALGAVAASPARSRER